MPKTNKEKSAPRITIAGIGASAGGIEALRAFFGAVPADLGLAYVVVVHLAPDHDSELVPILARCTSMPVVQVPDDRQLELKPNCVYVIAPDRKLEIRHTTISASPFDEPQSRGPRSTCSSVLWPRTTATASRSSCPAAAQTAQ